MQLASNDTHTPNELSSMDKAHCVSIELLLFSSHHEAGDHVGDRPAIKFSADDTVTNKICTHL